MDQAPPAPTPPDGDPEAAALPDTVPPAPPPPAPLGAAEETTIAEHATPEAPGRYQPVPGETPHELGLAGAIRVRICYDGHMGREVAVVELETEPASPEGASSTGGVGDPPAGETWFLREARVLGQLEHPSLLPIHELGRRVDGSYYYTTRRLRGRTLAAALKSCKTLVDRQALLPRIVDLCHGVAHAHSRGVLHRDLRPEHVVLGELGETVILGWRRARVRGQRDLWADVFAQEVKVLTEAEAGLTSGVPALVHPSYWSPEQARGEMEALDDRSEVWSLGAILYEVLTGHPPFRGETPWEVLAKVKAEPLVPAEKVNDAVPKELSAVCGRALARSSEARYPSASALAADLLAYMTGGNVTAHELSSGELALRFVARNKTLTAAFVFFLALLLAGSGLLYREREAAEAARRREQTDRQRAEQARRVAADARDREEEKRRKAEQTVNRAHHKVAQAYLLSAQAALAERRHSSASVFAAAALLYAPPRSERPLGNLRGATRRSASGTLRLPTAARSVLLQASQDTLATHDRTLAEEFRVWRVAQSPDGGYLAWCGEGTEVRLHSLSDQKRVGSFAMPASPVLAVAFSPDGKRLAAAGGGGAVRIWSVPDGRVLATLKAHTQLALSVAFSPDGKQLATGGSDQMVRIWGLERLQVDQALPHPGLGVWSLAYSPNGRLLASAGFREGEQSRVRVWDVVAQRALATFSDHLGPVWAVAFSPNGSTLASGGLDREVRIYNVQQAAPLQRLSGHEADITALAFSPDGKRLASGSADRTVRLWDATRWVERTVVPAHAGHVWGLAFSPDGRRLATGGWDRKVKLWRMVVGEPLPLLPTPAPVTWAGYVHGAPLVAAIGQDQTLFVLDQKTLALRHRLRLPTLRTDLVALSPKVPTLAYALDNRSVWLVDLEKGRRSRILTGHWAQPTALAFTPSADALVMTGQDGLIRILELKNRKERRVLKGAPGSRRALAQSQDGKLLAASVSQGKTHSVELWDLASGTLLRTLVGHREEVVGLDFGPGGRTLVTASGDQDLRVFDCASGRLLHTLSGHADELLGVAVSGDAQFVVSTSRDRTARLWSLVTGELLQTLRLDQIVHQADFDPTGRVLALPGPEGVRLVPLLAGGPRETPKALLDRLEKAADLRLEGMELHHPP